MKNINPYTMDSFTERPLELYRALEVHLFEMIAKRLSSGRMDYTAVDIKEWEIEKLRQLNIIDRDTVRALSRMTGIAAVEIERAIIEAGEATIAGIDKELKQARVISASASPPTDLDRKMKIYTSRVYQGLDNFVNQRLITTTYGTGTVARTYQKIVNETTAQVIAGQTDLQKAIADTTSKWAQAGMDSGFRDKSGRIWSVDRYAEALLRNSVNDTYNDLRTSRMEEFDQEFVRVSALPDAREACSYIQGQVVSMKRVSSDSRYPSIYDYGYGKPDGVRGINCRHILYPFIPGVNINNEDPPSPAEAQTRAKEVQKQRLYEREIRKRKRALKAAEAVGDPEVIDRYKRQITGFQAKLREHIKEHDLPRMRHREQVI